MLLVGSDPRPARVSQARNRTANGVERTVPFGPYCYTITIIWYALHGHRRSDVAARRK